VTGVVAVFLFALALALLAFGLRARSAGDAT
jgi:hypothetical protein